jgi:hypothetical protein
MYPKCSSWANLATFSISEAAIDNLEKTYFISDPNCIDIILS